MTKGKSDLARVLRETAARNWDGSVWNPTEAEFAAAWEESLEALAPYIKQAIKKKGGARGGVSKGTCLP